jgi:hypothetical protein
MPVNGVWMQICLLYLYESNFGDGIGVLMVGVGRWCAFKVAAGTGSLGSDVNTLGTGATTLGDGARNGLALGDSDGTGEGMTMGVVAGSGSRSGEGHSGSAISVNILANLVRASCC